MEEKKTKPFPWICPNCREQAVSPILRDYAVKADHDGSNYEVTIRDVVPTCSRCGQAIITSDISERVSAELRRLAGLLPPEKIRAKRESLGLTTADLAATLRVAEPNLVRWENGMQLQPRAVDLLLRLYFDSVAVRQACVSAASAGAAASATTQSEPRVAG
jgi:putative zinc finger/helix-turn-helix YgiT family protein